MCAQSLFAVRREAASGVNSITCAGRLSRRRNVAGSSVRNFPTCRPQRAGRCRHGIARNRLPLSRPRVFNRRENVQPPWALSIAHDRLYIAFNKGGASRADFMPCMSIDMAGGDNRAAIIERGRRGVDISCRAYPIPASTPRITPNLPTTPQPLIYEEF